MAKVHLTKSRFKVGASCATKLYYLDRSEYGNANKENAFLQALAEGGFQVGELAKMYHEGGVEVETLDKEQALKETEALLTRTNVIIYEAAVKFGNLFIRADILIKHGTSIRLLEVKAKSYDPREEDQFYTKSSLKKGPKKISSTWEPYLLDVAFQCFVVEKAYPKFKVSAALVLADKSVVASVDGLNQRFFLGKKPDGRVGVKVSPGTKKKDLGTPILTTVEADEAIEVIRRSKFEYGEQLHNFEELVNLLSKTCENELFISPIVGQNCKSCEFRISTDLKKSLKSGFEKCWSEGAHLTQKDFDRPFVFDIWNFRKSAKLIEVGTYFMDQLHEADVEPSSGSAVEGLSNSERQWLQVEKVIKKDKSAYFDIEGFSREARNWTYPLHFIDFETTMVAIPFHTGRRPYEQIAFQFSHHIVEKDGEASHKSEYINIVKGKFPNFDFVRSLMKCLSLDSGTIFRYATHENTVLSQIRSQLLTSEEADRDLLIKFIESITNPPEDAPASWKGERRMVDMCELVKKYFYHPKTKGSNSIKKVLPAILDESDFLQSKYSKPVYGSQNGIKSSNFKNWTWIKMNSEGSVVDPYKLLPPIFSDLDLDTMDSLIVEGSIADGGAAMTAYARMQFTEMEEEESKAVTQALLKYCELDTFAMVLIFEYWQHEIHNAKRKVA
jgi:hypothetical protein